MDRRLGRPLPHQPANPAWAHLSPRGLSVPRFHPQVLCGISVSFPTLSPSKRQIPMRYSPVRHSTPGASSIVSVRLACVKHAASVQSEPESNSSVLSLTQTVILNFKIYVWMFCLFFAIRKSETINSVPNSDSLRQQNTRTNYLLSCYRSQCQRLLSKPCTVAGRAL